MAVLQGKKISIFEQTELNKQAVNNHKNTL